MARQSGALPSCSRNEAVNRLLGGSTIEHLVGVGFLLKPTAAGFHIDDTPDHYAAVLVLSGEGWYTDHQGRRYALRPGSLFQRLPGQCHSTRHTTDGRWSECFLRLGAGLFNELSKLGVLDDARPVLYPGLNTALIDDFDKLLHHFKHKPSDDLPEGLALAISLLSKLYQRDRRQREATDDQRLVREASDKLSQRLADRLRPEDVAEEMACGYERFRKLFKTHMGVAPGEYRIKCRIEQASSMLASGQSSVKEVAIALGYPDVFSFSKQFKKVVGVAPKTLLANKA